MKIKYGVEISGNNEKLVKVLNDLDKRIDESGGSKEDGGGDIFAYSLYYNTSGYDEGSYRVETKIRIQMLSTLDLDKQQFIDKIISEGVDSPLLNITFSRMRIDENGFTVAQPFVNSDLEDDGEYFNYSVDYFTFNGDGIGASGTLSLGINKSNFIFRKETI